MKILVVGGAGYIGSQTARVLRRAGFDVLIYDNLSTGFEFLTRGFEMVVGDVHDSKKLLDALKQTDAVMYFAANHYVGESVTNPRKYYRNNVEGGLSRVEYGTGRGQKALLHLFFDMLGVWGSAQESDHGGRSAGSLQSLRSFKSILRTGAGVL